MDNEPTALFESYENDFQTLIKTVKEKVDGEAKEQRGGVYQLCRFCFMLIVRPRATQSNAEEGRYGAG